MANFKRLGNTVFKCNEPTDAMQELCPYSTIVVPSTRSRHAVDTKSTYDNDHQIFRWHHSPSQSSKPYILKKSSSKELKKSDFFWLKIEWWFFRPQKLKIITKIGWNKSGTGEKDVKMHFGNYSNWIWPFTSPQSWKTLNLFNLFSLINWAKSLGPKSKLTQMKEQKLSTNRRRFSFFLQRITRRRHVVSTRSRHTTNDNHLQRNRDDERRRQGNG